METETVLAALPVMVRYIAPVESLLTVKLFNCAPLPLSTWLSLMQAVTVSLRPPYHLSVFAAVLEPFMTVNMPPHLLAALTYLKQVALVVMANEPPPVMTVGLAHGSEPPGVTVGGTGVFVRVAVGTVSVLVRVTVG